MRTGTKSNEGFTLIELVVVVAIMATLSTVLFFNFRSASTGKTARNQVTSLIQSDIRRAQTMTTSSTQFNGAIVCGFGIHYVSATSYIIYAGAVGGSPLNCTNADKNYNAAGLGADSIVQTITLQNPKFNIKSSFLDIFFEPPDPKTYINRNSALNASPTIISVGVIGQACGGGNCTNLTVKTSGAIDVNDN